MQPAEMHVDLPSGGRELLGKRGGEGADEPEAKRGRVSGDLTWTPAAMAATVPPGPSERTPEHMDTGVLMPTFGLEILRCDGDPRDGTEAVDAIGLDVIQSADEWIASDDVKGGALDPERVMDARAKELQCLRDHGVYEYVTVAEAKATSGKPPLRLKWIDSNKGDSEHPNYRCRLVCTEVRRKGMTPIFSATPPI